MNVKVLLVQADASSRKAITECLRREGFEVDEALDGESVVWKLFQERKRVDLLIYDFDLPQEDRIKAAVALRSTQAMIPIVKLTGFPSNTPDKALFHGSRVSTKAVLWWRTSFSVPAVGSATVPPKN